MATRYAFFESQGVFVADIASLIPTSATLAAVGSLVPATSFIVLSFDDTVANAEVDLVGAMATYGFAFVGPSTLVAPVFAQVRNHGRQAVAPTIPAPGMGDTYFDSTLGYWLVFDGAAWNPLAVSMVTWGNDSVAASTTTRFLSPGFEDALAQTVVIRYAASRGRLRNMRIRHNVVAGNGNAIVYTLRVNGVATLLLVSLASTAVAGSNVVDTIPVAAGDLIDIIVTKALGVGTSPTDIVAVLDFIPA